MSALTLAVDNGPTDDQWDEMIGQPEKYLPLIERVVGLFLMKDIRTTEEMLWDEDLKAAIPALCDLTDNEMEFVSAGARHVLYQDDPGFTIRAMARWWLDNGAVDA